MTRVRTSLAVGALLMVLGFSGCVSIGVDAPARQWYVLRDLATPQRAPGARIDRALLLESGASSAFHDASALAYSRTEGLRSRLKRNEQDQANIEERVERVRKRLLQQYGSLDTRMSTLNGLSTYVTQQLAAFNNSNR